MDRQAAWLDGAIEALAVHELHRDEPDVAFVFDCMQGDYARVVEPRDRARLALEARQPARIARDLRGP